LESSQRYPIAAAHQQACILRKYHDQAFTIAHPLKGGKVDPDGIVFVGDGAWDVNVRIPNG